MPWTRKRRFMTAVGWPLLAAVATGLLGTGCGKPSPVYLAVPTHGVTGRVYVAAQDKDQIWTAYDAAASVAARLLKTLDGNNPDGDVARMNAIAHSTRWPVPRDLFRLFDLAQYYARLTRGAYDMTAAPLHEHWGFLHANPTNEPLDPEVAAAISRSVGAEHVKLSDDGAIAFTSNLTKIDPWALAHGYAVDVGIVNMRRQSVTNAMLNLGTTWRSIGKISPLQPWRIAVHDPWNKTNIIGYIQSPRGIAVARLDRLDRAITLADGQPYSRVMDARTGWPAEGTASALVVGPLATKGSALAYALLVDGVEEAAPLLAAFPRYEAAVVPDRQPLELWCSARFMDSFTFAPGQTAIVHRIAPPGS